MEYHKPVLLDEVLDGLQIAPGKRYIDCTLGDAGHTIEILKRGGKVLGLDVDSNALERAYKRLADEGLDDIFLGKNANFKDFRDAVLGTGFEEADGILFDLGYSSSQLDEEELGLSFTKDQELDMRLDKRLGVTAADLVNALGEKQLADIFFNYSDERLSRRFAKAIVERRDLKKFTSTKDLADLLAGVAPSGYENHRIHPATRVFQALRIAVNDEIENLRVSLPQAAQLLLPGGRMAVISFHSLEDKTVKDFARTARPSIVSVSDKPITPTESEVKENSRSRSAKLRILEKVK